MGVADPHTYQPASGRWLFTSNPDDPCSLCVQWRCERCKSDDWPNCCDWMTEAEPYLPDGSVVPAIFRNLHDECNQAVLDYQDECRRMGDM